MFCDSEPLSREHPSYFCLLHFLGSSASSSSFLCLLTSLPHNSSVSLRRPSWTFPESQSLPIASTTSRFSNLHGGLGWLSNPTVDPNSTGQVAHAHNPIHSTWHNPGTYQMPRDIPMTVPCLLMCLCGSSLEVSMQSSWILL